MESKHYSIDLKRTSHPRQVQISISQPIFPAEARKTHFVEHVFDTRLQESTNQVITVGGNVICFSDNLGRTWEVGPSVEPEVNLRNSFTTARGTHLLQALGWSGPKDNGAPSEPMACIHRFDRNWRALGSSKAGDVHWHGTASIDQCGETIMFSEYPMNDNSSAQIGRPAAVWRSRNDGESWEKVYEVSANALRHFHTCVADPYVPASWWISSGDRPQHCRIWRSTDDGSTWREVTDPSPQVCLPVNYRSQIAAVHRHTDLKLDADYLWWGTDDTLCGYEQQGLGLPHPRHAVSRFCRSRRGDVLSVEDLGAIGLPVRSLVDVGDGFVVLTEAKFGQGMQPEVHFALKTSPGQIWRLFKIQNHSGRKTGFTHSRSSRKAKNGFFFTDKGSLDAFEGPPCIIRWRLRLS